MRRACAALAVLLLAACGSGEAASGAPPSLSGGITVFAHPRATVRGRVVPDQLIVDLAAAGLGGLEADHTDHSPEQREHVRGLAKELGLLVTGSSDFHGSNKTVQLGACLTAPDQYEQLVTGRFLEPVTGA